jgi:hypothetical protein
VSFVAIVAVTAIQAMSSIDPRGLLQFVMIIGAPFLVAVLIHVFLIAVLIEAWLGRVPRMLAIIPLGAYAGYYAYYVHQGIIVASRTTELRAQNSRLVLQFDPDLHALISPGAQSLVEQYAIPAVYESNVNVPEGYLSYRLLRRQQCDAIPEVRGRVYTTGIRFNDMPQATVCELRFPEAPAKKRVTAVRHEEIRRDHWFGETLTEITVDERVIGSFTTATMDQLLAFPFAMIVCGVDSRGKLAPGHGCGMRFARSFVQIDTTPADIDRSKYGMPESVMLGIRKYTANDFSGFLGYPQNDVILLSVADEPKRTERRAEDDAFAVLKQIVDGGSPTMPLLLGAVLAKNPERLEPFVEAMASRLVELIQAKPGGGRKRVEQMQTLLIALAALPRDSFARVSGTLCVHLGRNPDPDITTTLCS